MYGDVKPLPHWNFSALEELLRVVLGNLRDLVGIYAFSHAHRWCGLRKKEPIGGCRMGNAAIGRNCGVAGDGGGSVRRTEFNAHGQEMATGRRQDEGMPQGIVEAQPLQQMNAGAQAIERGAGPDQPNRLRVQRLRQ